MPEIYIIYIVSSNYRISLSQKCRFSAALLAALLRQLILRYMVLLSV